MLSMKIPVLTLDILDIFAMLAPYKAGKGRVKDCNIFDSHLLCNTFQPFQVTNNRVSRSCILTHQYLPLFSKKDEFNIPQKFLLQISEVVTGSAEDACASQLIEDSRRFNKSCAPPE